MYNVQATYGILDSFVYYVSHVWLFISCYICINVQKKVCIERGEECECYSLLLRNNFWVQEFLFCTCLHFIIFWLKTLKQFWSVNFPVPVFLNKNEEVFVFVRKISIILKRLTAVVKIFENGVKNRIS